MNRGVPPHDARIPTLALALLGVWLAWLPDARAQAPGEQEFKTFCAGCHTIGGGRLVGPDLDGVHERRSEDWLRRFVTSAQSMIDSGDSEAVAIYEEYSRLPMPDAPFSAQQIDDVLSYVEAQSNGAAEAAASAGAQPAASSQAAAAGAASAAESAAEAPSEAHILRGQDLFQGSIRLANGGPACNACHDVVNDAVIGGGILAAELTTVFSRMGTPGLQAVLGRPPFPVMQAAYEGKPLTEDEVEALVAFLQYTDSQHLYHSPRDYGAGLFLSGVVGGGVLLGLFSLVWRGRKRASVYQTIYDRQIEST